MADADFIRALAERTAQTLRARRRIPAATYRMQFHKDFRFRDALARLDYLKSLGITALYASPYLQARPGSQHGYDITDHGRLNSEIGTDDDFRALSDGLRERGLDQVLDVVPNHMGIMGNENAWWNDVLENGPASIYAGYFDIAWHSPKPDLQNRLLLPVLGDPYGKALEASQIRIAYEAGAFTVRYFDNIFPISPSTYDRILKFRLPELEQQTTATGPEYVELLSIITAITHLPPSTATEPEKTAERHREKEVIKRRIKALTDAAPVVSDFIRRNVDQFNGSSGDPHSFDLLDSLLNEQCYRLSSWRVASDEINYRRFFDINELAALSMEKPEVFAATHALVLKLLREQRIGGLRIDHPDGLFDPRQYLRRLQQSYALEVAFDIASNDPATRELPRDEFATPLAEALAPLVDEQPLYVVVEKILGKDEPFPDDWPAAGTTGYDFLHTLNDLFVDHANAKAFTRLYHRWTGQTTPLRDLAYQKKYLTMQVSLSSELKMLAHQLDRLAQRSRRSRDFTLNSLRRALREITACFEVYRTYITGPRVSARDQRVIDHAVARAKRLNPALSGAVFDFVRDVLLLRFTDDSNPDARAEELSFIGKFQQLTAPVTAKGLEDTVFYVYNRLISLNEVGGDPGQFGAALSAFHERNHNRLRHQPRAMSATATHDTKRGEDARARINVLSEIPSDWKKAVSRWYLLNKRHKQIIDDERVPDRNEEYFFYQTLVGALPSPPPQNAEQLAPFVERIQRYMQKAIHEAKVRTSWINPNPTYDEAVRRFVAHVLDPAKNARFLVDFADFHARIAHFGAFNSLGQTLLKVALPGVPDIYQGTELWDFSLVDPDNRRPVDYATRRETLADLDRRASENVLELCHELLEHKADGRIKMYVLSRALRFRREFPTLFTEGEYLPARATEPFADNICAFVRRDATGTVLAVVPRLLCRLLRHDETPLGPAWRESVVTLPQDVSARRWRDLFSGTTADSVDQNGQSSLALSQVLAHFPVALLTAES
jgi:(1->4)-alpha-D-glucan 1-alpha-D-glucosylmutase